MAPSSIDHREFRRVLARNIIFPLVFGLVNAAVFIIMILYLLSALRLVEHTEAVIGKSNEVTSLMVDMQAGMRGFMITADDAFLAPYRASAPKIIPALVLLREKVSDNEVQLERLTLVESMYVEWFDYTETAIALRRSNGDYLTLVRNRGLQDFIEIRRELADFQTMEQRLLVERRDDARSKTVISIIGYLVLMALVTGLLSFFGRRELVKLSTTYGESLAERQQHAQVLELQNWQRAGQARLADQSVGQTSLAALGQTILDFLVNYLGASAAAFYSRNPGTQGVERVASYGFRNSVNNQEQILNAGDSLVE